MDTFFALLTLYIALGAAAFAVGSVLRLRGEEATGRVEVLLSGALSRYRLMGSALAVAGGGATLLLVVGSLAMGLTAQLVTGDGSVVWSLVGAALARLPAVLVLVGVAAALVGLVPRWSTLAWVPLGWAVLAGMFGALLRLPDRALRLSPFHWVPDLPGAPPEAAPLVVLTLVAAALGAAGVLGYRRRDVPV